MKGKSKIHLQPNRGSGDFRKHPENINRKGRPKMPDLREELEAVMSEEINGVSAVNLMLKSLRLKAFKGDHRCAELLLNRSYGNQPLDIKVTQEAPPVPIWKMSPAMLKEFLQLQIQAADGNG